MRHVPIVGSLYNWISPLQKPQIKGRCLSLQEGTLQSSDIIYNKPNFNNIPEEEEDGEKGVQERTKEETTKEPESVEEEVVEPPAEKTEEVEATV